MLVALWSLLAQYGGGGSGGGYGGGGGSSTGYWIIVGIIAVALVGAFVWVVKRTLGRRTTGGAARSEPHRTDRAA